MKSRFGAKQLRAHSTSAASLAVVNSDGPPGAVKGYNDHIIIIISHIIMYRTMIIYQNIYIYIQNMNEYDTIYSIYDM